ncbi:MAG: HutD family protein [Maribacter sp.]|nr:HutD family protein [Maribacter sp.]
MKTTLLRSDSFTTSFWSGGTTTQLFIYPEHAQFKNLNFDFRLSTARVTAAESIFTSLPGVDRKLLVLDGKITLAHDGEPAKSLHKFQVDQFNGGQKTKAFGKCTDFNLMTRGDASSHLWACEVNKDSKSQYELRVPLDWLFVYVYSGEITAAIHETTQRMHQGDLFILREVNAATLNLEGIKSSELILVEIVGNPT